jgi:hypothetical protein
MKLWIIVAGLLCASGMVLAQQTETVRVQADSIFISSDTVKAGNFIIIQKNRNLSNRVDRATNGPNQRMNSVITISTKPRNKKNNQNVVTNWGILDLGFTNINDNTN